MTVASYPGCRISLLLDEGEGGGTYARDKNTSVLLCAKNAGAGGGAAYLRDTTVYVSQIALGNSYLLL